MNIWKSKKKRGPSGISNVYIIFDIYKTWEMNKPKSSTAELKEINKVAPKERLLFREELELENKNEDSQIAFKNTTKLKIKQKINEEYGVPEEDLPPWERSAEYTSTH